MTMPVLGRRGPALLLALSLSAPAAVAQSRSPAAPVGAAIPVAVSLATTSRLDSVKAPEIILPSVVASGAPRSYQVVSIPVPESLRNALGVEVEIIPRGEVVVLGPRTRTLESPAGRKTRLGVTIGIPAGALAGHLVAAEARFSANGSPTLIIPVEIDVSLVRQLLLRPGAAPLVGQAGNDFVLSYEVVNLGNARETVDANLALPTGWRSRELRQNGIVIDPGTTVKRRVRVSIPTLSSTGSSFLQIDLRQGEATLASSTLTVEVFNAGSIGRHAGPNVVSAVSHATDETGRPNRIFSLTANGALFDSVRVDARMSLGSPLGGAASNALARLGTFTASPSVTLSAPSGQLSLGNTGTSLSELTGLYPYGQGALLHLRNPIWEITTLGALSVAQPGLGKREPMIGLRGERQLGQLQLSSSISHLADAGNSPRRLDAVGVGAAIPSVFGSTLKAEIAERQFLGGRGFGWSSEMVRSNSESSEQFRITHAPGGSDAFARATSEVIANVSEKLTSRATVTASAWRTTDETSVFSSLASNGFSLRPQYALRTSTTLALEMRSYLFDATSRPLGTSQASAFGTRESQLGASFSTYVRQFYLNSSAYLGNVTRTVTPSGQGLIKDRSPRNYWATNAGWSGVAGVVELHTRIEQTRDRGGFVNQQNVYGIRGEHVVLPWLGGIRADGELQRVSGFGNEKASIVRAGVAVPLLNGFALKVDAERNSIFHTVAGRVPWIVGARIEHSLTLPMLRTPGTSGYVYQDMNGNQRRDRGEPGMAGAVVRRGSEISVADSSGKYRVAGDARQPVVIDEASLPDGWTSNGAGRGDVGVSLSTSAEVQLIVAPRSGISDVEVDLSKALVIARDASGREWAARMIGPATATFDALPVGTYTLVFDLSELSEPLVPRGPIPPLVVSGKESRSISITLDPRPIRMWNGPGPRGGAGAPKGNAPSSERSPKSTTSPAGT